MSNSRNFLVWPLLCLTVLAAPAISGGQDTPGAKSGAQPPIAYASVNELNGIVTQLQQTAQSMQSNLARTRIEKWKTDASTKQQTLSNVQSLQRNLQSALPEIISQLNNSPEDVSVSFKLYRNLDALYDVFSSVVESAGAFGSKDEFNSLGNDMTGLETARRTFGERVQKLTASKEEELIRLRAQIKTMSAAPPPPPKKIVVDDTEPAKKPAVKKKATKPKATDAPPSSSTPK